MKQAALVATGIAALLSCPGSPSAQENSAPWRALTSPTAALKVVFDEVCLAAVLDTGTVAALAENRRMVAVNPRRAGSPTATAAWRLASLGDVHAFHLPNGGCSASVERGSPAELNAAAVQMLLARRPDFTPGLREPTDNGRAERTAYCTPETDRPYVVAIYRKTGASRRVAFLANVFRAEAARPSFCNPS